MKKISAFLLLAVSTICSGQKTKQFADSLRKAYAVPELSYAVADSKQVLEIAALGKHSVALPDTATLNDRFHLGSNTKAMTAFMIARYVEKGKLKWTTRFFDLFPGWKAGSDTGYLHITLQQLLSHRAGILPFQGENDPPIPDYKGSNQQKRKQFAQFVLKQAPMWPDADNPFVYSNAGYTLAALMLEKVTGKNWEQLVEQVFNKDLHLNAKLSWPDNQRHKDTWGHSFENDTLVPTASNKAQRLDYTEPAGDINMKLKDYIKFIQLQLDGLKGNNNYLKAATYTFLHKGAEHYAMGWYNIYENGKELSTHSGTADTYYTLVHIDRIKYRAYIIFTNAYNDATKQAVRLLMRKLKENYGS